MEVTWLGTVICTDLRNASFVSREAAVILSKSGAGSALGSARLSSVGIALLRLFFQTRLFEIVEALRTFSVCHRAITVRAVINVEVDLKSILAFFPTSTT